VSPIRLTEARQTTALSRIGTRAARAVTDSGISHRKDQWLNSCVIRRVHCIFNCRGLGTLSARIESHCVPLFCLCLPREFSSSAGAFPHERCLLACRMTVGSSVVLSGSPSRCAQSRLKRKNAIYLLLACSAWRVVCRVRVNDSLGTFPIIALMAQPSPDGRSPSAKSFDTQRKHHHHALGIASRKTGATGIHKLYRGIALSLLSFPRPALQRCVSCKSGKPSAMDPENDNAPHEALQFLP